MTTDTPIDSSARARGGMGAFVWVFGVAVAVELLLFLLLIAAGRDAFLDFVWTPDTPSYIGVAEQLAEQSTLGATPRTLGYPLFAAVAYVIGGEASAPYLIVAVQLLLNLCLTWLGWRLLERTAPQVGVPLRVAATLVLFWAGTGMATFLMTDLLASFCFAVFLYGFLFWRDRRRAVLAATALACATLTRPTFTFVPLLLPVAAYLVRHVTARIVPAHVLLFATASFAATSISLVYQYTFNQYRGPSPLLIVPIQETLYRGVAQPRSASIDYATFQREFAAQIEKRAGQPFAAIPVGQREAHAKELFREAFRAHPVSISAVVATNAVKYVFAPIESLIWRTLATFMPSETYTRYVRPVITAACLPIFLLSLVPPQRRAQRMYYALMLVFLVYIVGFSSIGAGSGERIRFPMLAFMFPVALWNASALRALCQQRVSVFLLSSRSPSDGRLS